jgi:ribosomal protein L29
MMMNKSLKHYGILGMRWGVRKGRGSARAKKSGGTSDETGVFKKVKKETASADYIRTQKIKRKKLKDMSDQELKTFNQRMELEKKYSQLTAKKVGKGKQIFKEALENVARKSINTALDKVAEKALKKAFSMARRRVTP